MRPVPIPGLADGGRRFSPNPDAIDVVVVGGVLDDDRQAWNLSLAAATTTGHSALRDSVGDPA